MKKRRAFEHRLVGFGQILGGMIDAGNNFAGFAPFFVVQPGGGLDIHLGRPLVLRLQGDYQWFANAGLFGKARGAIGIVVRS